ncbi:jg25126 [Pararge aegeria aegeria]|uniref:Jg25126 protein n=1 Tax=Pararge aegeria aegeria TaxID=348720 RepID=A0A8S4SJ42_9NEOP|nr:jg25126 [Pararge aegeria aegeria]
MDVGVSRCEQRPSDPAPVNVAWVGPQRGGSTTSNESLKAAGNKQPRTVVFGTPTKDLCAAVDFNRLSDGDDDDTNNTVCFMISRIAEYRTTNFVARAKRGIAWKTDAPKALKWRTHP